MGAFKVNKYILFIAVMFGISKNQYYGWNFNPQSDAEMICNGIIMLIVALALVGYNK